jgi:hypothetical protein
VIEIRKPRGTDGVVPLLIYLVLSACGTGIFTGIAGCDTYSGRGTFFECFWLYAIPIPMALGIFKIPTQIVGGFFCAVLVPRRPRLWAGIFAAAFLVGLGVHLTFMFLGHEDSWVWFPFITLDFAILAVIACCVRGPDELPRD